jgi:hypothetical protein
VPRQKRTFSSSLMEFIWVLGTEIRSGYDVRELCFDSIPTVALLPSRIGQAAGQPHSLTQFLGVILGAWEVWGGLCSYLVGRDSCQNEQILAIVYRWQISVCQSTAPQNLILSIHGRRVGDVIRHSHLTGEFIARTRNLRDCPAFALCHPQHPSSRIAQDARVRRTGSRQ